MIDHLGIQVADVDASVAFHTRVLAPLGVSEAMRYPVPPSAAVEAVHAAAVAAGVEILHAPREWPCREWA